MARSVLWYAVMRVSGGAGMGASGEQMPSRLTWEADVRIVDLAQGGSLPLGNKDMRHEKSFDDSAFGGCLQ